MIQEIISIWNSGGWVMIPLSLLAVLIYTTGFDLILYLNQNKIDLGKNDQWKDWIHNPDLAPKQTKKSFAIPRKHFHLEAFKKSL